MAVADTDCSICLQRYVHPVELPCGHIFCFLCIKGCALHRRRCPMCRGRFSMRYLEDPKLVSGKLVLVYLDSPVISVDAVQIFFNLSWLIFYFSANLQYAPVCPYAKPNRADHGNLRHDIFQTILNVSQVSHLSPLEVVQVHIPESLLLPFPYCLAIILMVRSWTL
ncbi:unnamed protein product [Echinostoma caproni]|uniref:E3 ubiquitin-protein ligase n=1 Tax=Echinostoma caproni TaxID=27848 RepID=A0A183A0R0_9TREM|nr:unnamed protein product [Echinostoma caproni]